MNDAPTSRWFDSQGLRLHYLDWGNAGAPPLLLVHGTRDHARSWDWTARALRDRWHVLAVDLRGHGDSQWSPDGAYLFPYHALDLANLADALGPAPLSIVGHSFGGNVVARHAALLPDRVARIVFVDSLGPDPRIFVDWHGPGIVARSRKWLDEQRAAAGAVPRRFASVEEAVARMAHANPRLPADKVAHLAAHAVRRDGDGWVWKFDPRASIFAPEDFVQEREHYWRAITAPVLILHGRDSWTSDPEEDGRAAVFRDARVRTFDDAGHWIHHDRLEAFLGEVEPFLAGTA